MILLSNAAQIFVNGQRRTFKLYKTGSAENHATSDDVTLRTELIKALNAPDTLKESQGNGVYRVKINGGKGYLVYKLNVQGPDTAAIFHYHWNYRLDLPLSAL